MPAIMCEMRRDYISQCDMLVLPFGHNVIRYFLPRITHLHPLNTRTYHIPIRRCANMPVRLVEKIVDMKNGSVLYIVTEAGDQTV
jgi:hypothetical protein